MEKPNLLYLSPGDGLDPRSNKEVATLSQAFTIDFVGITHNEQIPFSAQRLRRVVLIKGRTRSLGTLCRYAWRVLGLLLRNRYQSVHVINDNFYLLLLPLLVGQHVVLDIFDSIFLRVSVPRWLIRLGQRLCYALPAKIIVTDDERAGLMPDFVRHKLVVLPNYPFRYTGPHLPRDPALLRLLYVGSLSGNRGTTLARRFLETASDVRVVMAGWQYDEESKELARHPHAEWLGTIPQAKIIEQATRCDFILCHYEPISVNNIYASPNKIYDAIQADTAVLINPEVKVSNFVREHRLGIVLDSYMPADFNIVLKQMRDFKAGYQPDQALHQRFIWEKVESSLLAAHRAG